jgi:hypothetical protein
LRERTAAFAAALAVVPVVYPRLRTDPSLRTTTIPDATFVSSSSLGSPVRAIHSSGILKLLTGSIMEEYSEVFYYKCIDVKIGNGPIDFRERLARLPARISDFNRDMTDLKLQNYRKKV